MTLLKTVRGSTLTLACALCLAAPFAQAEPDSQRGRRHGPPPQAIDACRDQTENSACEFTGRRGKIVEGNCISPPRLDAELVCAPEAGRRHQRPHRGDCRDSDDGGSDPEA